LLKGRKKYDAARTVIVEKKSVHTKEAIATKIPVVNRFKTTKSRCKLHRLLECINSCFYLKEITFSF